VLLTDKVADFLPAKLGATQFPDMLALLERSQPAGRSDLNAALHEARTLCSRRGVVILISDLFTADAAGDRALANSLADWQAAGHDVLVIHLMDPVETKLPAHGKYVTRDLETSSTLRTDVTTLHEIYEEVVSRWRNERRSTGESSGLDWLSVTTAEPIADTLAAVLARRALIIK
jgi:uncharacterized protein (DUF58 family)